MTPGMHAFRLALFSLAVVRIFSSPDFNCLRRTLCHLLQSAAASSQLSVLISKGLHVALADIFETQLGAANSSLARSKFAVEDVLGYTAILHTAHVAKPSQLVLSEYSVNIMERPAYSRT